MTRSYEPYGTVLNSSGSTSTAYGFTGEWTDSTGLVHLRARYYASSQGRFLTADAWPGDFLRPQTLNGWGYAEGNPINRVDPSGYRSQGFGGNSTGRIVASSQSPNYGEPCIAGYKLEIVIQFGTVAVVWVPCETQKPIIAEPTGNADCSVQGAMYEIQKVQPGPDKTNCKKAIKILEQWERLADERNINIPPDRREKLRTYL